MLEQCLFFLIRKHLFERFWSQTTSVFTEVDKMLNRGFYDKNCSIVYFGNLEI